MDISSEEGVSVSGDGQVLFLPEQKKKRSSCLSVLGKLVMLLIFVRFVQGISYYMHSSWKSPGEGILNSVKLIGDIKLY